MAYQLTKDLETGNALIDREHRELIDAINALLDSCSKGQGRNELEKTAKFLQSYNGRTTIPITSSTKSITRRLKRQWRTLLPDCR